jgi:hypothetical protein
VKDFDIFKFLDNDADDEEESGDDLSSNEYGIGNKKEDLLEDEDTEEMNRTKKIRKELSDEVKKTSGFSLSNNGTEEITEP